MIDTLIVLKDGKHIIEKYKGQNLDEYDHVAEINHEKLVEQKVNNYYYMEQISYDEIFIYLAKEFNYKF